MPHAVAISVPHPVAAKRLAEWLGKIVHSVQLRNADGKWEILVPPAALHRAKSALKQVIVAANPRRRPQLVARKVRPLPKVKLNGAKGIPKGQIEWLVDRMHVGTSIAEIEAEIRKRAKGPEWTEAKIKQAVAHAIKHHNHNRGIFSHVMRGIPNPSGRECCKKLGPGAACARCGKHTHFTLGWIIPQRKPDVRPACSAACASTLLKTAVRNPKRLPRRRCFQADHRVMSQVGHLIEQGQLDKAADIVQEHTGRRPSFGTLRAKYSGISMGGELDAIYYRNNGTATMTVVVMGKKIPVHNWSEASNAVEVIRDRTGLGYSQMGASFPIFKGGKQIAHVSYNGRVWAGTEYSPTAKPIYDPRGSLNNPKPYRGPKQPPHPSLTEAQRRYIKEMRDEKRWRAREQREEEAIDRARERGNPAGKLYNVWAYNRATGGSFALKRAVTAKVAVRAYRAATRQGLRPWCIDLTTRNEVHPTRSGNLPNPVNKRARREARRAEDRAKMSLGLVGYPLGKRAQWKGGKDAYNEGRRVGSGYARFWLWNDREWKINLRMAYESPDRELRESSKFYADEEAEKKRIDPKVRGMWKAGFILGFEAYLAASFGSKRKPEKEDSFYEIDVEKKRLARRMLRSRQRFAGKNPAANKAWANLTERARAKALQVIGVPWEQGENFATMSWTELPAVFQRMLSAQWEHGTKTRLRTVTKNEPKRYLVQGLRPKHRNWVTIDYADTEERAILNALHRARLGDVTYRVWDTGIVKEIWRGQGKDAKVEAWQLRRPGGLVGANRRTTMLRNPVLSKRMQPLRENTMRLGDAMKYGKILLDLGIPIHVWDGSGWSVYIRPDDAYSTPSGRAAQGGRRYLAQGAGLIKTWPITLLTDAIKPGAFIGVPAIKHFLAHRKATVGTNPGTCINPLCKAGAKANPWYYGYKKGSGVEKFHSRKKPTEASHGHLYGAVTGPFKRPGDMDKMYGFGWQTGPHTIRERGRVRPAFNGGVAENARIAHEQIVGAFLAGQSKRIGSRYWTDGNLLRVWGNLVAQKVPGGVEIMNAGYRTLLTKNVLNTVLSHMGSGTIWQKARQWYISTPQGKVEWPGRWTIQTGGAAANHCGRRRCSPRRNADASVYYVHWRKTPRGALLKSVPFVTKADADLFAKGLRAKDYPMVSVTEVPPGYHGHPGSNPRLRFPAGFRPGDLVKVSEGSGVMSRVTARVMEPFDWRREEGSYKPVPRGWLYLQVFSDGKIGELFTMPANRCRLVGKHPETNPRVRAWNIVAYIPGKPDRWTMVSGIKDKKRAEDTAKVYQRIAKKERRKHKYVVRPFQYSDWRTRMPKKNPVRYNHVEGWVVTQDGETIKAFGDHPKGADEAFKWLHKHQSKSVSRAIAEEGYDIVCVVKGKTVYSMKRDFLPKKNPLTRREAAKEIREIINAREMSLSASRKPGGRDASNWQDGYAHGVAGAVYRTGPAIARKAVERAVRHDVTRRVDSPRKVAANPHARLKGLMSNGAAKKAMSFA